MTFVDLTDLGKPSKPEADSAPFHIFLPPHLNPSVLKHNHPVDDDLIPPEHNHQQMPPSNSCKILFFLCISCLLGCSTRAIPNFIFNVCPNTTFREPNNSFQTNLNTLLTFLSSNATRGSGFYNATVGRGSPGEVYGLFLCRGDVTTNICRDCVATAGREIVTRCPRNNRAYIWYDECLLRYSNQSIFSVREEKPRFSMLNIQNVTNQTGFMLQLTSSMNGLVPRTVVTDRSGKKFATAQANLPLFQSLYSLAQCTPDLSEDDCKICLQGAIGHLPVCCNGKQGGRVVNPSCNVRYELYRFYESVATAPPTSPAAVTPPGAATPSRDRRRISSGAIAAIVAPIGVSVILFSIGCCILVRRSRSKKKYDAVQEDDVNDITTVQSLQYDLASVEAATNNFCDDNKLGEGGFGAVYKGILPNGQEIAVKRLSQDSGQGAVEFKNEIALVAKLQHRNLVRLLGFCLEGNEKILIYEFVPNKSLDYFLFDPEKQKELDWSKRYKIIEGIARGILYLHEDSRLRIIHRDLKASNILIDEDMSPKISDFGMARIFVEQSQDKTSRVVGTYGYMAPEYAMHGQFSVKSDVFSFGVLVLEIISGKKNSSFDQSDATEDLLLSYAWKHWKNNTPLELMDPTLADSYSTNEVLRCIQIGLLCVQEDVEARPSMATVVLMLDSHTVSLALPKEPPFFGYGRTGSTIPTGFTSSDRSKSNSVQHSVNEVSITELYPR